MTCTRPDLAYPLNILARYVAPGRHRPEHMAAAKRVLRYLCSTSGMGLMLGGRRPVVLTGHADASWADDQAMQRSSQGYSFSLGSGSVSWRSTRSSSVLSSSCEAEIYAGAMDAQELRWLTYLLTDLGEQPRSPLILYVDNKAMLALCGEHRLEHRTKHIALRYFLARELQQRGQLRLAYVASQANTADIFTKALPPGDHQRFCTMLACFALLDWSCDLFAEADSYQCVPPDPGIEAAALGASESSLLGTTPVEALDTFTLDSGASRIFFRDSTTLTPLFAPVPVRLADPSASPVVARSSTVLPTTALQDSMVTLTTPGGQRVSICTCTWTGRHLATFTHPGSSLYTLFTEPPQVAVSAQVSASSPVAPPCSCRLLSHQTLLWHHRLGHPSLPRLRGMHSRLLVSGLPRSPPPLPPSPAPPYLPCVEGRQRASPHSSSFPPMTAPLQTLHMDVKGQVVDVLILWIRAVRLQLRERVRQDLPVLHLHFVRAGEFSSDLLRDFCHGEGIRQSFTPQQNGIVERRIGLVMEDAAHQLNHRPRVSLPETSPTLRWMGEVGDASVFRVWGSRAFVRNTSADNLSARAIPCVFLGFSPYTLGWQFYHPTWRRVFPSQDVMFDESVPFYRVSQVDPLLGTAPVEIAVGSDDARGAASGGVASGGAEPGGAECEGARSGGAEPGGEEPRGAKPMGVEPGGAESEGAESRGA
ncbi:unnamed protein product [Closterium sp. NIES-53]